MTIPEITPQHKLILFWTNYWSYGRTPEVWVRYIKAGKSFQINGSLKLVISAVDKMFYETLITDQERNELLSLLNSADDEGVLLALSIMASRKPKKFAKSKKDD